MRRALAAHRRSRTRSPPPGREPDALHNNCSGKHAGFVCLGCVLAAAVNLRQYARGYVRRATR